MKKTGTNRGTKKRLHPSSRTVYSVFREVLTWQRSRVRAPVRVPENHPQTRINTGFEDFLITAVNFLKKATFTHFLPLFSTKQVQNRYKNRYKKLPPGTQIPSGFFHFATAIFLVFFFFWNCSMSLWLYPGME